MKNRIAEKLTERERQWVIEAAAQACEAAYRRGFQQGVMAATKGRATVDLHAWRYKSAENKAPNPDGANMGWSAVARFAAEPRQYDPFINLGFDRPDFRID